MERSQIHRVSVADQVAGILRQRILEGELRPGTPLPVAQLSLKDVHEIYQLRRMLEVPAVLAAKSKRPEILDELRNSVDQYEKAVRERDWAKAVNWDLHMHGCLIRFYGNKRLLETFYQKVLGEAPQGQRGRTGQRPIE